MIRDTLFVTCQELGPLSGTVSNKSNVFLEPTSVIPNNPTLRPADLMINLSAPTPNETVAIALDVSIPSIQLSQFPRLRRTGHPKTLLGAHREREREKWDRKNKHDEPRLPVLRSMEEQQIALIPFTIDHLGGLGHQAHAFLFHPKHAPFPSPPHLSPNNAFYTNCTHHPTRIRAFNTHFHLLTKATQQWSSPAINFRSIGTTYHSQSPVQWALQMLSVNFCQSFASHFEQALWRCTHDPRFVDRPTDVITEGRQSFHSPSTGPQATTRLSVALA